MKHLLNTVMVSLFVIIMLIVLAAVVFRGLVNQSLTWSDEVVRYLFVWFTLIGSASVLRERRHIRVEFFTELLPTRLRRAVDLFGISLVTAFNVVLVVAGFLWLEDTRGTLTPALGLPLNWLLYGALPVSALLCVLIGVRRIRAGEYAEVSYETDETQQMGTTDSSPSS